jgi:hypothetical protein
MKRIKEIIMLLGCLTCGLANAEISDSVVRIGVLNDISGLFQDTNGMGSVEAAPMAANGRTWPAHLASDAGTAYLRSTSPSRSMGGPLTMCLHRAVRRCTTDMTDRLARRV